jgi:hypothetical protein
MVFTRTKCSLPTPCTVPDWWTLTLWWYDGAILNQLGPRKGYGDADYPVNAGSSPLGVHLAREVRLASTDMCACFHCGFALLPE